MLTKIKITIAFLITLLYIPLLHAEVIDYSQFYQQEAKLVDCQSVHVDQAWIPNRMNKEFTVFYCVYAVKFRDKTCYMGVQQLGKDSDIKLLNCESD